MCISLLSLMSWSALPAKELGKYQLILDKQLLGVEKVVPQTINLAPPKLATPSWSLDYRMTMITQDERGIRIGLQNLKTQSAVLLIEGDTSYPDFQLVSADYRLGNARVRFKGSEHQFTIQDGPVQVGATSTNPSARNPRGSARTTRPGRVRTTPSSPEPPSTPQVRKFNSREELQTHLREQQMDAIRTGKPPLPIPLTPQMDNQLVKEGVLPPQ